LSALNNRINSVTERASALEKISRQKEERYAKEQEATVRKATLNERIAECAAEEKKVGRV